MKTLAVLFLILSSACMAQQPFDWPFQPGDRVVVGDDLMVFGDPIPYYSSYFDSALTVRASMRMYPFKTVLFEPSHSVSFYIHHVGVTKSGMFVGEYGNIIELFPQRPQPADTVYLHEYYRNNGSVLSTPYRYCTNIVEFDTTIFGEQVRAFSADIYGLDGTLIYRYTLAEKYWIVRVEHGDGHVQTLNRYKIGSELKDIGPYTFELPYLCTDLELHYRWSTFQETPPFGDSGNFTRTVSDTTINDTTYFFGAGGFYIWQFSPNPIRPDGSDYIERTETGERTIHPKSFYLGDTVYQYNQTEYWFCEIDTVHFHGERVAGTVRYFWPGTADTESGTEVYYSGVGTYSHHWGDGWRSGRTDLETAELCLAHNAVPALPSLPRWQAVVYPSPAREYITVSIQHAATAAPLSGVLYITDELGRTVLSQQWDEVTERSSLTLPVAGFAPGVYYYRLAGSSAWLAGQFVVK